MAEANSPGGEGELFAILQKHQASAGQVLWVPQVKPKERPLAENPFVKFKSTDMREKRQTNFLRTTTVVNSARGEVLADCHLDSRPVEKSC